MVTSSPTVRGTGSPFSRNPVRISGPCGQVLGGMCGGVRVEECVCGGVRVEECVWRSACGGVRVESGMCAKLCGILQSGLGFVCNLAMHNHTGAYAVGTHHTRAPHEGNHPPFATPWCPA